jgi:hypothetical protein
MNKIVKKEQFITIVSGLPRSGTSMMMAALQAGGMELLIDGVRLADLNNPKGYFEFERVKKLPKGDVSWVNAAKGKAVKIISSLLPYLPDQFNYRIIFMTRNIGEILSSQERMLERSGKSDKHPVQDEVLQESYLAHLQDIKTWLGDQTRINTLYVSYNDVLLNPRAEFAKVTDFLNHKVDPDQMVSVIDKKLYRERMTISENESKE